MDKDKIFKLSLSQKKAEELLKTWGKNELTEKKQFTFLKSFLSQFNNFLIYLLLAAAIVSYFVGEPLDSFFIFVIVILNACFGVYQEYHLYQHLRQKE